MDFISGPSFSGLVVPLAAKTWVKAMACPETLLHEPRLMTSLGSGGMCRGDVVHGLGLPSLVQSHLPGIPCPSPHVRAGKLQAVCEKGKSGIRQASPKPPQHGIECHLPFCLHLSKAPHVCYPAYVSNNPLECIVQALIFPFYRRGTEADSPGFLTRCFGSVLERGLVSLSVFAFAQKG